MSGLGGRMKQENREERHAHAGWTSKTLHRLRIEQWDLVAMRWQCYLLTHLGFSVYGVSYQRGKDMEMHLLQHLQVSAEGTITLKVKFTYKSISFVQQWHLCLVTTVSLFGTATNLLLCFWLLFTCTNRTDQSPLRHRSKLIKRCLYIILHITGDIYYIPYILPVRAK